MTEPVSRDLLLGDPLSEVTRKERRMLLAISLLGVGLVKTGLVPTKIEALGVEFDRANQQALLFLLAVVAAYFLAAFLIYAAADFLAWRRALRTYENERRLAFIERRRQAMNDPSDAAAREAEAIWPMRYPAIGHRMIFMFSGPVSILRAVFEFFLPLVVGAYAVSLLWSAGGRI